jgi:hypothetical protein
LEESGPLLNAPSLLTPRMEVGVNISEVLIHKGPEPNCGPLDRSLHALGSPSRVPAR